MTVLLFDYDGVIANTFEAEEKYLIPLCQKHGVKGINTDDDLRGIMVGNMFECMEAKGISVELYEKAFAEFYEFMRDKCDIVKPYDGIIKLLDNCSKKMPVYIVTSNIFKFPNEMLNRHGIKTVAGIWGLEEGKSKVEKINRIKKMYPKEELVFITDSCGDVKEAHKSKADEIVSVTWGCHDRGTHEKENPNRIFDTVKELSEYIEKLY